MSNRAPLTKVPLGDVTTDQGTFQVFINTEWAKYFENLIKLVGGDTMTVSYAQFFSPVVLGITAATLFTVPTSPSTTLMRGGTIRLANTTGVAATVTLYAVQSGGTASDANAFVKGKSVPANDYIDVNVPILPVGAFVQALAGTAASITASMIAGAYFS